MTTVNEIEARLKQEEHPTSWIKELEADSRVGVQKALNRWYKAYERRQKERLDFLEKVQFDASFKTHSEAFVAGVDEAGRGPLAGPVVTASVILPANCEQLIGLDDSKTVTAEKREAFAKIVKEFAVDYSIHIQPASMIDDINIYEATRQSMESAVNSLDISPDFVIVDAMQLTLQQPTQSVVKADAKSLAVAAASILAKTTRDQLMKDIHEAFPMYQFDRNAGYGTKSHIEALNKYGPCMHHRKTFEPIKSLLNR